MKSSAAPSERLSSIHIYSEPSSKTLDLHEISGYLKSKLGKIPIDVRPPLLAKMSGTDQIARDLASTKIRDLLKVGFEMDPLPGEIDFERRLLSNPALRIPGIVYDGYRLQALLRKLLPEEELDVNHIHTVFTNRLFATWDEGDGRYHARVSVYGFPSIISTSGIVEAPAKPKEYYILKQRYATIGAPFPDSELAKFSGKFVGYDDPRLTDVMKGYVMQALFYHIFGEPFCEDKKCRLFNSHWQEDVIESQLGGHEICDRHMKMLNKLKPQNH
ncbi:MAG: DUF6775 family putative metallopeptidase [Candidatus Hadarchaeota archaeon]